MDIQSGILSSLALGFLLGLKHATDADHVVAVSTIAAEYRNPWRGIWVGGSWGLGHTTPLVLLGIIILAFKEAVLERYAVIAPIFEFGVGLMLVFLGAQVFWNLRSGRLHLHEHTHGEDPHMHIHASHSPSDSPEVEIRHGFFHFGKPHFRVKSYTVGMIHGLAGSATVMLILLPSLASLWAGIAYLLLFGLGTMLSMGIITLLLGVPFAITGGFKRMNGIISCVAGVASIVFGAALMSDLALGTTLMPF